MPKIIDVPGHGHVEFPDNMTDDQIVAAIQRNMKQDTPATITSLGAGLGKGFGDVVLGAQSLVGKGLQKLGETVTPDQQSISGLVKGKKDRGLIQSAGDWLVDDATSGRAKLAAEVAPYQEAHPIATGAGEVGGNVVATLPVGGMLASGMRAAAPVLTRAGTSAPLLARLANSVETSGLRTGAPAATTTGQRLADLAMRSTGGAVTGGASAALVNQDSAGTGAVVGAALPPGMAGAGKAIGYAGRGLYALAQPFTKAGQERLAGSIINKFAKDGPTVLDTIEHIPGSMPTLAEATGNAGIARLQSVVHDVQPNRFAERAAMNAAAREAAFDGIAGDRNMLNAATEARDSAADALYGQAFTADAMRQGLARDAQARYAPFSGVGLSGAAEDLATPGLRALAQRPGFKEAVDAAKRLAANNGVKLDDPLQSLEGLHYVKLALDDALNPAAKTAMGRNASAAVMDMRNKLTDELAQVSPLYGNARQTFAEMSKPINAMEALQGLTITDSKGNITLSKVQSAIRGLEARRAKPGVDAAKSVTDDQLKTLYGLRDDLLRQARVDAGKSRGATTLQNIATDNIISSFLPGKAGEIVGNKVGGVAGQLGRLMYSGSNEAVRTRLADLMLAPEAAKSAMESAGQPLLQQLAWPNVSASQSAGKPLLQLLYRAAPVQQASSQ